jgi:hypothetical protein
MEISIRRNIFVISGARGRQAIQTGVNGIDAWWCPGNEVPAMFEYDLIRTTVEAGVTIVEWQKRSGTEGHLFQLEVYTLYGKPCINRMTHVISGPLGEYPIGNVSPGQQPMAAWYCPAHNVSCLDDYSLIDVRIRDGQTWVSFRGAGGRNARSVRLDVYTAFRN